MNRRPLFFTITSYSGLTCVIQRSVLIPGPSHRIAAFDPLAKRGQQLLLSVLLDDHVLVGPGLPVGDGFAPRRAGDHLHDVRPLPRSPRPRPLLVRAGYRDDALGTRDPRFPG